MTRRQPSVRSRIAQIAHPSVDAGTQSLLAALLPEAGHTGEVGHVPNKGNFPRIRVTFHMSISLLTKYPPIA